MTENNEAAASAEQPVSKLTVPHAPDCRAIAACASHHWRTPWYLPSNAPQLYLDRLGRKNAKGAWRRWVELRCNATNCDARCIVLCDAIEELGPTDRAGEGKEIGDGG